MVSVAGKPLLSECEEHGAESALAVQPMAEHILVLGWQLMPGLRDPLQEVAGAVPWYS